MDYCPNCGLEIVTNIERCSCGFVIKKRQETRNIQYDESEEDAAQKKVFRYSKIALLFSLIWLGGIGSIIAIINAGKALRIIKYSRYPLSGKSMAVISLILGILGASFWGFVILMAIFSPRIGFLNRNDKIVVITTIMLGFFIAINILLRMARKKLKQ